MSRADWFPNSEVASLVDDFGDPIVLRWPDDGVASINGVDASDDWRKAASEGHGFADFEVVIDIHTSHLPSGIGKAQLVPNGTVERVGLDAPTKPLRISDYRPQGQGIVALICEP